MSKQFTLNLLGGFAVYRDLEPMLLPPSCRRVVTLTALKRRKLHRSWICETLWPGIAPDKAVASLRSALWRLRPVGAEPLLVLERQHIMLAPEVLVDWYEAENRSARLPAVGDRADRAALRRLLRNGELLDGWTDRWCAQERERYRVRRLAALSLVDRRMERHLMEKRVAHYACSPVGAVGQ